ncbi:MAG TPA: Imm63 family immunity protein [Phenylobacterium sp.]
MLTLAELEAEVVALARRIDAPADLLPTFGVSQDGARPHLEVDVRYHFVVVERGVELERRSTQDLQVLLYWTFETVTFSMATAWELRHRREGEDFRVQLFGKQLALLAELEPAWSTRKRREYVQVLKRHPLT